MDYPGSMDGGLVPLDVVSSEFREILAERTPRLVVERRDAETLYVVGFDTLEASTLLRFADRHKLYGAVQLGPSPHSPNSGFDIIVSRRPIELEGVSSAPLHPTDKPDKSAPTTTRRDLDSDEGRVTTVRETIKDVQLEWINQVTFPRVLHVQLMPSVAVDFASLEDILLLDFVKGVRLGGGKRCVEVIVRRKPTRRARRRQAGSPYVVKRKADCTPPVVATKKLSPNVSWQAP